MKNTHTREFAVVAMLSAVAFLLAFFELPMPFSPAFARLDFSDLPALLAAFAFGPVWGIVTELVKNLLQLLTTSTAGIGELANFLMGSAFVTTAGIIYQFHKSKIVAAWSCVAGSIAMAVAAGIINYFLLLPVYETFMPLEQIIVTFAEVLPFIEIKWDVILWSVLPSNLCKGVVLSVLALLIYKPLSPILKGNAVSR